MSQRVAVLMKLKDGVTKGEVRELCALLRRIGDPTALRIRPYKTEVRDGQKWAVAQPERAKTDDEIAQKYDDEYGDPVFYIP